MGKALAKGSDDLAEQMDLADADAVEESAGCGVSECGVR